MPKTSSSKRWPAIQGVQFVDSSSELGQYRNTFVKQLATAVHQRLPREIRNYIWAYCVQSEYDDEVIVRRRSGLNGSIILLVRECLGPCSYGWIEDPITSTINVSVLGEEVTREMLESYYRARKFKISHRDLSLVEAFLKTDTFRLGVFPGSCVRRLELDIQVESVDPQDIHEGETDSEDIGLQAMEALGANVTARTDIAIEFYRDSCPFSSSEGGWDGPAYQQAISPRFWTAVESLRCRRPRARIMYRQTWRD